MNKEIFSSLEIDTIGEIMNISMGSAATAASTLLDNKVTITTPTVRVVPTHEFELSEFDPAVAVNIRYVEGISGDNILILKKSDVRMILSQMMMTKIDEDFEIDMMAESAICELMNQMMGSSATVLSCFLGRTINISTPTTVPINQLDEFKQEQFGSNENIVIIEFVLTIKDMMESKFMSVMQIDLAKEIIGTSLNFDSSDDLIAEEMAAAAAEAPPPPNYNAAPPPDYNAAPTAGPDFGLASSGYPATAGSDYGIPSAGYAATPAPDYGSYQAPPASQPNYGAPQPPYYGAQQAPPIYPQQQSYYPPQQPAYAPPAGAAVAPVMVQNYNYSDFAPSVAAHEAPPNLDLVMAVPVVITVELGRTKRKIKEILEFGQGTIVELDKQAGSQVDVIVNGQLIAHGDVVVVDDNFSIRITEILKTRDALGLL